MPTWSNCDVRLVDTTCCWRARLPVWRLAAWPQTRRRREQTRGCAEFLLPLPVRVWPPKAFGVRASPPALRTSWLHLNSRLGRRDETGARMRARLTGNRLLALSGMRATADGASWRPDGKAGARETQVKDSWRARFSLVASSL